jgi:hypothetical protein
MKILGWLTGSVATLIDKIGEAIDRNTTTDAERLKLNNEVQSIMAQFIIEAQRLAVEDTANARKRETDLRNTVGVYTQNIFAGVAIVALIALIYIWVFIPIQPENKDMLYMLLGYLSAIVMQIFSYWFGSSEGSQRKDQFINKQTPPSSKQ